MSNNEQLFLALKARMDEQAQALEDVKREAAEGRAALETKVEDQRKEIEELRREVKSLKETTPSSKPTSQVVQTGDFARRWRGVFFAGGWLPHGLLLASLKYGDQRLLASSRMFEIFGGVCSIAAAFGNPRNFESRNEKLFIILCSLTYPAYLFLRLYISNNLSAFVWGCISTPIFPPCFLACIKLYSKFSDRRLAAAITTIFKSLPGLFGSMLYIGTSSLQCIINSKPEVELDERGFIKICQNPTLPTNFVSLYLATSWFLTYVVPPLLPSDRTLTWSDVMKLDMGKVEGLQFTLFCTFSMEALVAYALTDNEGGELNDLLGGLILIIQINASIFAIIALYEHVFKPAICKSSTRSHASSSVTSPDNSFSFQENALSVDALYK